MSPPVVSSMKSNHRPKLPSADNAPTLSMGKSLFYHQSITALVNSKRTGILSSQIKIHPFLLSMAIWSSTKHPLGWSSLWDSSEATYAGLTFDPLLTWNTHIQAPKQSCHVHLNLLKKLSSTTCRGTKYLFDRSATMELLSMQPLSS